MNFLQIFSFFILLLIVMVKRTDEFGDLKIFRRIQSVHEENSEDYVKKAVQQQFGGKYVYSI